MDPTSATATSPSRKGKRAASAADTDTPVPATTAQAAPPAAPELPDAVRLLWLHSFIADDGCHHLWHGGQVVREADQIALLLDRGAPVVVHA
jgi:hypothetical protein